MKRYYLDKLVQTDKGWKPSILSSPEWAMELEGALSVVTSAFVDGQPVELDCLLIVSAKNHQALSNLANITILPDFPLDAKVGSMHGPTKQAMKTALQARGVAGSVTDNADGFREIIEHIGQVKLGNAGFSADAFDA